MKKFMLTVVMLALAFSAQPVLALGGSVFGTQSTAVAIGQGNANGAVTLGLADITSFVGTFDYGMSKFTTGRLKLGFADANNSDMAISIGGEIRWQVWSVANYVGKKGSKSSKGIKSRKANKKPFDLSIGVMTEYLSIERDAVIFGVPTTISESVFQFGGFLLGSQSFVTKSGKMITPYGRFNIRLEDSNVEKISGKVSNSDIEIGFNTGVSYQFTNTMNIYGEFQFDGNDGLFIGVDFKVM
ncbi:MAG: hypothetical protein IH931_03840 [candidate division Zixibacteria bacterium]|nr:hypothetical protein [candidate division Zixibacteria bacterium]